MSEDRADGLRASQFEDHDMDQLLVRVPVELQQLKCAPDYGTRAQPHFHKYVNMANYKPGATIKKQQTLNMLHVF